MRFLLLGFLFSTTLFGAPVIKLGFALPLSGDNAHTGQGAREAILLRATELEKEPMRYRYEFLFEDDQAKPAQTNLAARKLLSLDGADTFVSFGSAATALLPQFESQYPKKFFWGVSAHHEAASGQRSFVFFSSYEGLSDMAIEGVKAKGYKRVAIIYGKRRGIQDCSELFVQKLPSIGAQAAAVAAFNPGERDFRTELTRIRDADPNILFVLSWQPECEIIVKRARELGIAAPLASMEAFNYIADKSIIEGAWYPTGVNWTPEFESRFTSFYNHPPTYAEGYFYDTVSLLVKAYETAAVAKASTKPTPEAVGEALKALKNYQGVTGLVEIPESGKLAPAPRLVKIVEGKVETVSVEEL